MVFALAACTNGPPPPPAAYSSSYYPSPAARSVARPSRTLTPSYTGCAQDQELRAAKTAAVKERLMVAGLTCKAEDSYNDFIRAYRRELQNSDSDLQGLFTRVHGKNGDRALDSYKTRIANVSMMDSIADAANYCASAKASFAAAKSNRSRSLENFIATQDMDPRAELSPCMLETASAFR